MLLEIKWLALSISVIVQKLLAAFNFITGSNYMKSQFAIIILASMVMVGCANSNYEKEQTSAPYIGEGNQEYESLYHYGYYRGCKNAYVMKKQQQELYDSVAKDKALDGLERFDNGWDAGLKACEDGVSRSMYNLTASK
ncbi:MAG: hypothetical protein ACI8SJ_002681 [Shewanella sp.]|jgi:hypothetical protein